MPRRAPLERRVGRPLDGGEVVGPQLGLLVLQEVQRQAGDRDVGVGLQRRQRVRRGCGSCPSRSAAGGRRRSARDAEHLAATMRSRNVAPSRTGSRDLALSMPIDVPSPPLSLMTTVAARASRASCRDDVDVGQGGGSVQRLDGLLGDQAGGTRLHAAP